MKGGTPENWAIPFCSLGNGGPEAGGQAPNGYRTPMGGMRGTQALQGRTDPTFVPLSTKLQGPCRAVSVGNSSRRANGSWVHDYLMHVTLIIHIHIRRHSSLFALHSNVLQDPKYEEWLVVHTNLDLLFQGKFIFTAAKRGLSATQKDKIAIVTLKLNCTLIIM